MKQGIHPANYRPVVFRDAAVGTTFLVRSTIATDKTITWTDGQTYPLVDLDVSSASHPFYTGQTRLLDTQGRIEKFERRYGKKSDAAAAAKTSAG